MQKLILSIEVASNNIYSIWQEYMVSVGVKGYGEFYIDILSVPGRSYELSKEYI